MKVDDLALVGGWPHTVATLRRWNASPWSLLGVWALGALAVALLLLGATWLTATFRIPDPSVRHIYPGLSRPATTEDFFFVLRRNGTVLALHALACVAGFIAGWTPAGERRSRLQARAGAGAIVFVIAATIFSLVTQADALGMMLADLAFQLDITPMQLLLVLLPHALPELFAVFLPLAAWSLASRRGAWDELLAATIATTAIAIPLLVVAGAIETWVTPRLLWATLG
ncbi:MAG TPA: stage II sporulation protein M [Solirubrobacter sp.]|nr:stage II sporulation protein M [Solirubrobacter sp.]